MLSARDSEREVSRDSLLPIFDGAFDAVPDTLEAELEVGMAFGQGVVGPHFDQGWAVLECDEPKTRRLEENIGAASLTLTDDERTQPTVAPTDNRARTPASDSSGQGSSLVRWVPPVGLEPTLDRF